MLNDFLKFDKMITPVIIKGVFWIGLIISVIVGLGMIISGLSSAWGGGVDVLAGILLLVLGPLSVRIYCELLMVMFKINDSLTEIKESLKRENQ